MNDRVTRPPTADIRTRSDGRGRTSPRRRFRRLAAGVAALTGVMLAAPETTAWAAATTYLSGQASMSGFPVGSQIFHSATLGWGVNPTGTITFRLYLPADSNCVAAPVFTTNTSVSGNRYYESARYVTTTAGDYRWTATYNGDSNNSPSRTLCSDLGAKVSMAKRVPTLSGSATVSANRATTTDTATLNGATPTGTMTFRLWGPNNITCAGGPIRSFSQPVSGSRTYTSPQFAATVSGTYQWVVSYSGDSNNVAAGTICVDPANTVNLIAGPSVSATPALVLRAAPLTSTWSGIPHPTTTDWVALYAIGAPDSAVAAWRYTNGASSGSVAFTVPWSTPPGLYEVRLLSNNSYVRLATSGLVTVI